MTAPDTSPGDRADSPLDEEEHGTRSPPPESAGLQEDAAAAPDSGSAESSSLDGLSTEQAFRAGPRGGAAGGPVRGSLFARGAVRSVRGGAGTFGSYSVAPGRGDFAGGALATSAGTQHVHGGGLLTLRSSAFDAANPYAVVTHYRDGAITSGVVKPADMDVQAGAHVGWAPLARWAGAGVWRERVLTFASLDSRLRHAPVESTPAAPSFYALSPTQRALLGARGVSAAQTNAALNYLDRLTGEVPRSATRLLSLARVDLRTGTHDAVAATFASHHLHSPAGAAFDQLADAVMARGRASVGDSTIDIEAFAGHWAHTFRPRLENALRAQWAHDVEAELPRAPLPAEPAISPGGAAPEVEIEPEGFSFGTPANLDRTAYPDEHRVEIADTLRAVVARHVLTLGGGWSRVADHIDSLRNANGTFLYDSDDGVTTSSAGRAGGLVDWITDATFNVHAYPNGGCPSITAAVHDFCFRTYTQSFGTAQTTFATNEFTGFAEDSFLPREDVRMSLGVRYDYTLLPLPQAPNTGLDASLRALSLPAPLRGATGAFPEDRNNVGPRAGLAWSPRGGRWFTAQAGYGWFYGRLPGATLRAALAQNGLATGIEQVRITPATETLCPQVSQQGFGYPCDFGGTPPSAVAQTGSVTLFASHFRLPAVQRAGLSVERRFGRHIAVQASYTAALSAQLPTSADVNIAPSTAVGRFTLQGGGTMPGLAGGRVFQVPLYTSRRLAGYGPITAITSQANATYHAGTLTAALRGWHGLDARGGVTFSRSIDDDPQTGANPRVNGSFDPFAVGYDKGLSDAQTPLRFAGSVIAHTQMRHGAAWLRDGLRGWTFAASATVASGAPYSYEIFGGTRLSGGHASINGSGGAVFLPTVGRNTLRLPARSSVHLRLERGLTIGAVKVNGFAEASNLLNQRSLSRVETRAFLPGASANGVTPLVFQDAAAVAAEGVSTPPFGAATSSTSASVRERLIALGVRAQF